jgi:hypothetical protein
MVVAGLVHYSGRDGHSGAGDTVSQEDAMKSETPQEAGTLALVWLWLRSAVLLVLFLVPGILLFWVAVQGILLMVR